MSFLLLLIPVLLFFIINFVLGQFIGHVMRLSYKDTVSLNLTTLARNSPVALAIAVTAFPDESSYCTCTRYWTVN